MGTLGTNGTESKTVCATDLPYMSTFLEVMPIVGWVTVVILLVILIAIAAIFIEEVNFILKTFKNSVRRKKTIWVLTVFPVFAFCAFVAIIVPRAGPLCDIISNMYFGTCLYNFFHLMVNYMGGEKRMWAVVESDRSYILNAPPCCCCKCLGKGIFSRARLFEMHLLVLQIAVVRPLYSMLAIVIWSNDAYHTGVPSPNDGYIYIVIINAVSTLAAFYGLMLLRESLRPNLEVKFSMMGKISSIQLTTVLNFFIMFIIEIFVQTGMIQCGQLLPARARADAIIHAIQILVMFVLCVVGRKFFRRDCDSDSVADGLTLVGNGLDADPDHELNGNHRMERLVKFPVLPETSTGPTRPTQSYYDNDTI